MDKVADAKDILKRIGIPEQQQTDIAAYALLTLAHLPESAKWKNSTNDWTRIHDVLIFTAQVYGKTYAENTRETIRKNCMHQFRDAALIEDNGRATNSPHYAYRITEEALPVIRAYGTRSFSRKLDEFLQQHERLIDQYASKKRMQMQPVQINGKALHFSPGKHNELQRAVIEEFAPRFAPGSICLYVGDTTKKDLIKDTATLAALGIEITLHDTMPDVVLYRKDQHWLYFIEAVTSVGPMSPKRILDLRRMSEKVSAGKIFVTAFLDQATYKKFSGSLAWDTEVWLAEAPDHMIHLNGDKFLGPR